MFPESKCLGDRPAMRIVLAGFDAHGLHHLCHPHHHHHLHPQRKTFILAQSKGCVFRVSVYCLVDFSSVFNQVIGEYGFVRQL